ncbi:hypothetical protein C5167_026803, partial [Papaver somniferum]
MTDEHDSTTMGPTFYAKDLHEQQFSSSSLQTPNLLCSMEKTNYHPQLNSRTVEAGFDFGVCVVCHGGYDMVLDLPDYLHPSMKECRWKGNYGSCEVWSQCSTNVSKNFISESTMTEFSVVRVRNGLAVAAIVE